MHGGKFNATKALADVVPMSPSKAAASILTKPITKTIGAAVPEGITEGVQSSIEDNYGSLNPQYNSAAVGQAAGIGGLVSVGLTGKNTVKAGFTGRCIKPTCITPRRTESNCQC